MPLLRNLVPKLLTCARQSYAVLQQIQDLSMLDQMIFSFSNIVHKLPI